MICGHSPPFENHLATNSSAGWIKRSESTIPNRSGGRLVVGPSLTLLDPPYDCSPRFARYARRVGAPIVGARISVGPCGPE